MEGPDRPSRIKSGQNVRLELQVKLQMLQRIDTRGQRRQVKAKS